jgi:hypothetical protein
LWDAVEASWEEGFERLQSFVAREGHARVLKSDIECGYKLGSWVRHKRKQWKAGRLPDDRIALLEALPGWVWVPRDALWEEGLASLRTFLAREGHARVPGKHSEKGFKLGSWVDRRRRERKAGKLSPDRVARLEALPGWVWDARNEE